MVKRHPKTRSVPCNPSHHGGTKKKRPRRLGIGNQRHLAGVLLMTHEPLRANMNDEQYEIIAV